MSFLPTLEELKAMPTLSQGPGPDLKVDTGSMRVWWSHNNHGGTIEHCHNGRCVPKYAYQGKERELQPTTVQIWTAKRSCGLRQA